MEDESTARARYPGILVAFVVVGPLLQVAVQIVAGVNDGFELTNWIVILLGAAISATALVLYLMDRRKRRR